MFRTAPFKHLHFRCDTMSSVDSLCCLPVLMVTRNSEVLEVACVFISIEAVFFPHFNIGLCFTVQNIHVTLTVTATFY